MGTFALIHTDNSFHVLATGCWCHLNIPRVSQGVWSSMTTEIENMPTTVYWTIRSPDSSKLAYTMGRRYTKAPTDVHSLFYTHKPCVDFVLPTYRIICFLFIVGGWESVFYLYHIPGNVHLLRISVSLFIKKAVQQMLFSIRGIFQILLLIIWWQYW